MWLFDDDICWCCNSREKGEQGCDKTECFRHLSNRKTRSHPDIFTVSFLKGTRDCPYKEEFKNV